MKLRTRLVIVSNEMPSFRDSASALARRALPLRCHVSFEDKKDPDLKHKLAAELPSILLWSIQGWNRIKNRRQFTETVDDAETREEIRTSSNNVNSFVAEACVIEEETEITLDDLYKAYRKWCETNGEHASPKTWFRRNLNNAFPSLAKQSRNRQTDTESEKQRIIFGIRLRIDSPFS